MNSSSLDFVAKLKNVSLEYGTSKALDDFSLNIPGRKTVGIIGPDGVGKSSLLALISGAREIQKGQIEVLGGDMSSSKFRKNICPKISYMPQGLGRNLYHTLSVFENVDFFARLFDIPSEERKVRIPQLLQAIGLGPFANRPAGKLSGGMKQKLGLCCALIHDPDLLILDEPTTGVDPLSRKHFWGVVASLRELLPDMSVVVASAYMEEAKTFDWLIMVNDGKVLAQGTPEDLLKQGSAKSLEEAYINFLPAEQKRGHTQIKIDKSFQFDPNDIVIEAHDLTMKFGDFVAVDKVNFKISRGVIYGFLGSNGCGKTTTMKMLTGLLPATEGTALLFGEPLKDNLQIREKIGFMTQSFSLYTELSLRQNLVLHARLFSIPEERVESRVKEVAERFGLLEFLDKMPMDLPLGQRQRLSLATALIHSPEILILDEPTSGVDPVARDEFWRELLDLSRNEKVTIFISTHFMNEAERCDNIALMHAGKVLKTGTPDGIIKEEGAEDLEDAFNKVLTAGGAGKEETNTKLELPKKEASSDSQSFSFARLMSYTYRESLEILREPLRLMMAILGSVILLVVMCFGISFDIEDLKFAVLDQDQSQTSRDYILNLSGSKYFTEKSPVTSMEEINDRLVRGDISMALIIPPNFGQELARGAKVEISAWVDGSHPARAESINGYVQGMHASWLNSVMSTTQFKDMMAPPATVEIRYRYNPDVKSIVAMVPAVIPILLMLIPAILTALAVVREKELGSITNLYVTPVSRLEFILGKQLPYVFLATLNFILLVLIARLGFGIVVKGSYMVLLAATVLYVFSSTGLGLLMSSFTKTQVSALFGTAMLTILPAIQFSGLIDPVSSMEGVGAFIGKIYPTSHFLLICQGVFSKGLSFNDVQSSFLALAITAPVIILLSTVLLKKQET